MAGRSSLLPPMTIVIPRDATYSGQLKYHNVRACDIAAPQEAFKMPSPGNYQLVRIVRVPQDNQELHDSYGPVVLFYAKPDKLDTLTIHGGWAPEFDRLVNPDIGFAMHDDDLTALAKALDDDRASQHLTVSYVNLGRWKRFFRTRVHPRHKPRLKEEGLSTRLDYMRLMRRRQYFDDILMDDELFWIAVYADHRQQVERSDPERDAPFIPGGGIEQGAGATGSFDAASEQPTIRNLFESGKVTVGPGGRLIAGAAVATGAALVAENTSTQEAAANNDGLLAATLGSEHRTELDDEESARTVRARQFVFGGSASRFLPDSASEDIDTGAAIIADGGLHSAGDASLPVREFAQNVTVEDDPPDESKEAPAEATAQPQPEEKSEPEAVAPSDTPSDTASYSSPAAEPSAPSE